MQVHRPTDDSTEVRVQKGYQIQPAFVYPNAHYIPDPLLIEDGGDKITLKQIRGNRTIVMIVRGLDTSFRATTGTQSILLR
jgi:hypothetical protein